MLVRGFDTYVTCNCKFFSLFSFNFTLALLAHLWGAYAIPVALSGVRRPS